MEAISNGCIYQRNSTEILSYTGAEHIIPAGLGGIKKLPRGTVSDEVNQIFSKREMIALRDTFLSVNRDNNGPGKRGSPFAKEVKTPKIELFEAQSEQLLDDSHLDTIYAPMRLGFLFYGEVQMIPQILFPIRLDWSFKWPRVTTGTILSFTSESLASFMEGLKAFLVQSDKEPQKDYIIVSSEIKREDRYFILGFYNHIWFVNTSLSDGYIQKFFIMMEKVSLPDFIPVLPTTKANYNYNKILPKALDDSFEFIYVKTAFNVIAFLMGADFVRDKQFDVIREAIVHGKNLFDYNISRAMPNWLVEWVQKEVKPKSHFVVIHGHDYLIEAYVSFYREPLNFSICLSRNYHGEEFKRFFICNYKERCEKYGDLIS